MENEARNDLLESLKTPKQIDEMGIISLVTQWKERNRGRLNFYQIGRKILYSDKHLSDYLALCERKSKN